MQIFLTVLRSRVLKPQIGQPIHLPGSSSPVDFPTFLWPELNFLPSPPSPPLPSPLFFLILTSEQFYHKLSNFPPLEEIFYLVRRGDDYMLYYSPTISGLCYANNFIFMVIQFFTQCGDILQFYDLLG